MRNGLSTRPPQSWSTFCAEQVSHGIIRRTPAVSLFWSSAPRLRASLPPIAETPASHDQCPVCLAAVSVRMHVPTSTARVALMSRRQPCPFPACRRRQGFRLFRPAGTGRGRSMLSARRRLVIWQLHDVDRPGPAELVQSRRSTRLESRAR